jgi:hypothetical protein
VAGRSVASATGGAEVGAAKELAVLGRVGRRRERIRLQAESRRRGEGARPGAEGPAAWPRDG